MYSTVDAATTCICVVDIFYNPEKVFLGKTKMIVAIYTKYDLYIVVRNAAVLNGKYVSLGKWKKIAKQIVAKRDLKNNHTWV